MPIVALYFVFDDLALNGLIAYPSLLYFAGAAVFNAIMDCVENEHIFLTKFSGLKPEFLYKRESWKAAKMIFGYRLDAWHLAKSCMIMLLILSVMTYKPVLGVWDFVLYGLWWNHIFNGFYNHVFKKNTHG